MEHSDDSDEDDITSPLPREPLKRSVSPLPPFHHLNLPLTLIPRRPIRRVPSRLDHPPTPSTSRSKAPSKPFNPTPVSLPSLPSARTKRRPRPLFTSSSSASGSGSDGERVLGDDTSESEVEGDLEEEEDSDDFDSEEEAWPVGPVNSVGLGGWRRTRRTAAKGKGCVDFSSFSFFKFRVDRSLPRRKAPEYLRAPEKLFGGLDGHEEWDEKSKASSWVRFLSPFAALPFPLTFSPCRPPPTEHSTSPLPESTLPLLLPPRNPPATFPPSNPSSPNSTSANAPKPPRSTNPSKRVTSLSGTRLKLRFSLRKRRRANGRGC